MDNLNRPNEQEIALNNPSRISRSDLVWALFSYLGVLVLIPFLLKIKSDFVSHHRQQGMALFAIEIFSTVILWIPFLGWSVGTTGWILSAIFSLIGLVKVLQKKYWSISILMQLGKKINKIINRITSS